MPDPEFLLRPFGAADYGEEARIRLQLDPTWSATAEEIQRRESAFFTPPQVLYKVIAEHRATHRVIGVARLATDPESFDPRTFWVNVAVDREFHGRGVSRALADALRAEAATRSASRLWTEVVAQDERSVRFATLQGFVEKRRSWRSRLIVANASLPPDRTDDLRRQGVTFLTLSELDHRSPAVIQDVYRLNARISADEPRLGAYTPVSLEQFVAMDLQGPAFLADAYFLARSSEGFIAMSTLKRSSAEPDTLIQAFTGTLPEHRGRGIATELKRRGTHYARAHGYRSITTGNDSLNHPMLAINRKLGYHPEVVRITSELLITP